MRVRRVALVAAVVIALAPVRPVEASWEPVLGEGLMKRLAACETGNDTQHRTRSFVSAFGVARQTWNLYADTPHQEAHKLTWNQQARVLDRVFWFGHVEAGRKQWAVGPYGHGCFRALWRSSVELRTRVCHNARERVRRWCRP